MTTNIQRIAVVFCLLAGLASAATLKPETKAAWDAYIEEADAAMQARLRPDAHFLWVDDQPGLAQIVRDKGYYIAPVNAQIPKKITSGLIHDWVGVAFLPNAKIEDVLHVVRDYDHYKDMYQPGVMDSVSRGHEGNRDRFKLRLVNKSVVAKTGLDAESEAAYFRVDDRHWYGFSNTVHIHEVDRVGTPEEKILPEGEGTGLIWELSSITRMEERDGGVYAELEAIALSRDIPGLLRIFVTPVVRRVSRDSLAISLHQTGMAVNVNVAHNRMRGGEPDHQGQ